jgi:tRNA(fMet)-specific endonuclease VapC
VTEEVAFEYGRIAIELKRIGRIIGQNDMMIAAITRTIANGTVVTMNGDFNDVPGLNVENWAS